MNLVAVASAKGSPGVTTTCLALGAVWGSDRVVVAECDPAGGDLVHRFDLSPEPGLVSLAAVGRRGSDDADLQGHCQRLAGGLAVLVGPPGAEQAGPAVAMLAQSLGRGASADNDIVADCGRLDPASPAGEIARRAGLVLVVTRSTLEALAHVATLAERLEGFSVPLGLVLVGNGAYPPAEVAGAIGIEVLGVLPHDPDGAALVGGGRTAVRVARRLPLVRYAAELAESVAARLSADPTSPTSGSSPTATRHPDASRPIGAVAL